MIPYGRQSIDEEDIQSVMDVLRSDWLTTGPKVSEFEGIFADRVGAKYAVAVSSGTAALHAAMFAIGVGPGDEVIVPTMTFAATANCVVYQGARPVFADVNLDTLLIDPYSVISLITSKTKAIIAVDYAGQPCDYETLEDIANYHHLTLVSDACHSLGGYYNKKSVGSLAELTAFSFHPVKHITTGEGGMITTDNQELANKMSQFRNHGITTDHLQRSVQGSWFYEMTNLGYNYRITDFQCALGISQLSKLSHWLERRREIARRYDEAFSSFVHIVPLSVRNNIYHTYHLYVVRCGEHRDNMFKHLREKGIGVNVHYVPVHLHPYYQEHFGTHLGMCPMAEQAYKEVLSLPMHPALSDEEIKYVIEEIKNYEYTCH